MLETYKLKMALFNNSQQGELYRFLKNFKEDIDGTKTTTVFDNINTYAQYSMEKHYRNPMNWPATIMGPPSLT